MFYFEGAPQVRKCLYFVKNILSIIFVVICYIFSNNALRRREMSVSVFLAWKRCVQNEHSSPNCRSARCFRPVDIKSCGSRAAAVNPAMFFSNCSLTRSARQEAFQITSLFYATELAFQASWLLFPARIHIHRQGLRHPRVFLLLSGTRRSLHRISWYRMTQ